MFILRPEFPDPGLYVGREQIAKYTRDLLASWSEFTIEAKDVVEAGDSVVVEIIQRGVGLSSGIATESVYFHVWTFRGDSILRIESIRDRADAMAVVGLEG